MMTASANLGNWNTSLQSQKQCSGAMPYRSFIKSRLVALTSATPTILSALEYSLE